MPSSFREEEDKVAQTRVRVVDKAYRARMYTLKRFTKRRPGPYATQADWSRPAIRGED